MNHPKKHYPAETARLSKGVIWRKEETFGRDFSNLHTPLLIYMFFKK
jgi:hypothetical protein